MTQSRAERFQMLTECRAGTEMGTLLRKFWQPVALSREVGPRQAASVKIMGEELTLYRGDSGKAYLIGGRCAHRRTVLYTGRVIGEEIRCHYHGWRYDGCGKCVDRPAEKDGGKAKISIPSYPVHEYYGLVFAWMGEGAAPEFDLPRKQVFDQKNSLVVAMREEWDCNWFQQVENSLDPVHVSFAHQGFWIGPFGEEVSEEVPELSYLETEAGIEQVATRSNSVRKSNWTFPNNNHIVVPGIQKGDPWIDISVWPVPVTDTQTTRFFLWGVPSTNPDSDRRFTEHMAKYAGYQSAEHYDELFHKRIYPDPEDKLVGLTYAQDYVAIRGQGVITDREEETLGKSDLGIVTLRNMFWRELDLQRSGQSTKQWRPRSTPIGPLMRQREVA